MKKGFRDIGKDLKTRFEKFKQTAPGIIANDAQRFFTKAFREQAWTDGTKKPWAEVKRRTPGEPAYEYPKKRGLGRRTRAILVGSGRLRREVNNSKKKVSFAEIRFAVAAEYAAFHNFGTKNLPQRQFMGESKTLEKALKKKLKEVLHKCMQGK